jgi:hypothetical protein
MIEVEVVILAVSEARGRPLHLGRGCRPPFNWDSTGGNTPFYTLIKKKRKFSSYIRKF